MTDETTGVLPPDESSIASDAAVNEVAEERRETASDAPPQTNARRYVSYWFSRGDQYVLCVLAVITLGMLGWQWAKLSGWGAEEIEIERQTPLRLDYKIDINAATWVEWVQLPGIGETLADRIVADRAANGRFESIDDLDRVKGIGPKTIARIRQHLTVGKSVDSGPDD